MRLLHWNILDGCVGDPLRLAGIAAWLCARGDDVVTLNECNGLDAPGAFAAFAAAAGFAHHALLSPGSSAYLVGVLSRHPLSVLSSHREGFAHGALHVATAGIEIIVTHWAPFDPAIRLHEARTLAAALVGIPGPALLCGDLNAHSPVDDDWLVAHNLAWGRDYAAHQALLAANLVDLGAGTTPRWSTATALNSNEPRRRLDFIHANPAFAVANGRPPARILHDSAVERLSDHWPVECAW